MPSTSRKMPAITARVAMLMSGCATTITPAARHMTPTIIRSHQALLSSVSGFDPSAYSGILAPFMAGYRRLLLVPGHEACSAGLVQRCLPRGGDRFALGADVGQLL